MDNNEIEEAQELSEIKQILAWAGRFPLLTKEQEYILIGALQQAEAVLAVDPSNYAAKETKQSAFRELCQHNLRLVISIAKGFRGKGISLGELVSEGTDGIRRAAELFKRETGNKFSTYATLWIKQKMFKALKNKVRLIKPPEKVLADVTRLKRLYYQWAGRYGKSPTSQDLADEFHRVYGVYKTARDCEALGWLDYDMAFLDEPVGDSDDGTTQGSFVSSGSKYEPESVLERTVDTITVVERLLPLLDEIDARFLRLKWGIGFVDQKARSDREMAEMLGKTTKQIKEWERRIVDQLRRDAPVGFMSDERLVSLRLVSSGPQAAEVAGLLIRYGVEEDRAIDALAGGVLVLTDVSHHIVEELAGELEVLGATSVIVT